MSNSYLLVTVVAVAVYILDSTVCTTISNIPKTGKHSAQYCLLCSHISYDDKIFPISVSSTRSLGKLCSFQFKTSQLRLFFYPELQPVNSGLTPLISQLNCNILVPLISPLNCNILVPLTSQVNCNILVPLISQLNYSGPFNLSAEL